MTTQEKAHISPILQAIANSRALNLRAINIDLYYIPKFKSSNETLEQDIKLAQEWYYIARSDARDSAPTIGSGALIELYTEHNIFIVPENTNSQESKDLGFTADISMGNFYYIVLPFNENYKIVIGL